MKIKYSALESLQIIVLLILFGLKLIPQFQYSFAGTFWSLAYQGMFVFWLLLTMFESGVWFRYLRSYYKNWTLWIVFLLLGFLLFPNTQLGFLSLNLTFWEPMLMFYYYTEIKEDNRITTFVSIASVAFLIFGLVQSIQSVNVNELAAREATSGHSSEDGALTGNYSFTATLSILIPVGIAALKSKINTIWKIISMVGIALSIYFVLHCNLMISIICMLLAFPIFLLFSANTEGTINRKSFVMAILFVLVIVAFPYWKGVLISLFSLISEIAGTSEIEKKVMQLTALLNGSLVGNVNSRFELCVIAIRTFLKNPIIGIGPQNNADIYFLTQLGLHATFFDDLARYGIVGMSIMISTYYSWYKSLRCSFVDGSGLTPIKSGIILYIIISMLNPTISANVGIVLFFILPALSKAISE